MSKLITFWFVIFTAALFSQTMSIHSFTDERKVYPVDPRPYLERFTQANGIDLSQPVEQTGVLRKTTAWKVGDTKAWYSSDFSTQQFYSVSSTCRAVGNYCYIFVEDALWDKNVDATSVQKVLEAFEQKTPANSSKGIYQTNVETFGNPPDQDRDPKIVILILDIKDGFSGSGGYIAGYFYSYHEYNKSDYPYSNETEIYFLDGVQNKLDEPSGLETALSTTAHEFQHMIHWNYIKSDETFFDEAWSLIAEVVNGYPLYNQNYYANEPNYYLFGWRRDDATAVLNDYSRAARFSLYLKEQFGTQLFKKYLANKIKSANGLDYTLTQLGYNKKFVDILEDWFIANYLNNKNINSAWGYNYSDITRMKSILHPNPNITATKNVYKYGVQYITFNNGKELNIILKNLGNNLKAKAIKIGTNSIQVEDINFNYDYYFGDFGTTYNEITIAVYMIDQNIAGSGPFNFTYEAMGIFENKPIEIAYDNTEPVGFLPLNPGDSVAVVFNAVAGATIDSIKVAVRNLVPMSGGIYELKGSAKGFAGKKLSTFTVIPTLNKPPEVVDSGDYPYLKPYPNWVKVDLRDYNISADKDFTVIMPVEGNYPNNNRVMVTYYQSSSAYNSYWFQADSSRWIYYSVKGKPGYIFLNLIRAYVSYKITDNKEVVELLPASFMLEQNYPNPFNPSTTISYQITEMTNVQIIIYDVLGREIKRLVDEVKSAGKYSITWDGTDNSGSKVSSGVYFYKLITDNFVQTKKMILMK